MKLNTNETKQINVYKGLADIALAKRPMHSVGFNWGYLWGYIQINRRQKNGKLKSFKVKVLLTSGCPDNWGKVEDAVRSIPGVVSTFVNLD